MTGGSAWRTTAVKVSSKQFRDGMIKIFHRDPICLPIRLDGWMGGQGSLDLSFPPEGCHVDFLVSI